MLHRLIAVALVVWLAAPYCCCGVGGWGLEAASQSPPAGCCQAGAAGGDPQQEADQGCLACDRSGLHFTTAEAGTGANLAPSQPVAIGAVAALGWFLPVREQPTAGLGLAVERRVGRASERPLLQLNCVYLL
ncbi:MAG: hypothetical protein EA425_01435 [Puniceicoccaceae bacterium]|nr:MAG: hypothetical protein EA425_01435 [Puniceicoccaceae bacterium]